MDPTSRLIARKMFKLRVHEAKGSSFQRLFESIMTYRFVDFTPVKPYGNLGDRKNDGYIRSQGRYFQVFAPEAPDSKKSAATAASKAAADFIGLKQYWSGLTTIQEYSFVFNDEYRGSPPALEKALAKIRRENSIKAGVFLAKDLEAEALALPEDQLIDIIGTPIPETGPLGSVDFSALREVIHHVLDERTPYPSGGTLTAPDFDEKIRFNGLSSATAALLTVGSYQNDAIEDYFSKNSTFARQEVRDRLNSMYLRSRQRFSDHEVKNEIGDLVFFDLLAQVTPPLPSAIMKQKAAAQDGAIVVMSYYFEACDIFEDPNAIA